MEVWKEVVPFVEVSSSGQVRSKERYSRYVRKGREQFKLCKSVLFKPQISKFGYLEIPIKIDGKLKRYKLHRLIGIGFVQGYKSHLTINHINGIKTDNRLENLEWISHADNVKHEWRTGLCNLRGNLHPGSKLTVDAVIRARSGESPAKLAKEFGVAIPTICKARDRINWAHI